MFNRFANSTRSACNNAGGEAIAAGASVIDVEHLLLGILATNDLGYSLGLDLESVRDAAKYLPASEETDPRMSYSPAAVRVLRLSADQSAGERVVFMDLCDALLENPEPRIEQLLDSLNLRAGGLLVQIHNLLVEDEKAEQRDTERWSGVLTNLCEMADRGQLPATYGRDKETRQTMEALIRWQKNTPVLVGEAGVGKTAVVEGLAKRLAEGDAPEALIGCEIISLNMGGLLAGTRYRGDLEKRVQEILAYFKDHPERILFIDEIHNVLGAGRSEGALDVGELLKPALARGELRLLGATTLREYEKYIERNPAFERRLQPVEVPEPSPAEALEMVKTLTPGLEAHHGVSLDPVALEKAVEWTVRILPDRNLPDKAVDLLDQTAARCVLDGKEVVGPEELAQVLADWSGCDPQDLLNSSPGGMQDLEDRIGQRLFEQHQAVDAVCRALRRGRSGLGDPHRPLCSLLFCGPTGVGKTELARTVAEEIFGSPGALVRLDMSEYAERHDLSKLIGSPPGYVGHEEGGRLISLIRNRPHSVLVFDEIEKAHPDIAQILLQIFEEGRLIDGKGKAAHFNQAVIILTSNLGSAWSSNSKQPFGFMTTEGETDARQGKMMEEVRRHFAPELIGRLDDVVAFSPLGETALLKIVQAQLQLIKERLGAQGIELQTDESLASWVLEHEFDHNLGARPLKRLVRQIVEDPLADKLTSGQKFKRISIKIRKGQLSITTRKA